MTELPNSHAACGRLAITSLLLLISATPVALAEPTPAPSEEAVIVTLPFIDTGEQNRVVVDLAREGNRPLQLILDTGATFTTLTPLAARALGVTVRPHKSISSSKRPSAPASHGSRTRPRIFPGSFHRAIRTPIPSSTHVVGRKTE